LTRQIYIDVSLHYQFKEDKDGIVLLEYTTPEDPTACPGMGDRAAFSQEEGRIVARFEAQEKVEFILSSRQVAIRNNLITEKIRCGDDLVFWLDAHSD